MDEERYKQYIVDLYSRINDNSNAISLCSLYSSMIQIKHDSQTLVNYYQPIYEDIKCFIKEYVTEISNMQKGYGYDVIDMLKIEHMISMCPNAPERNELFKHAFRLLSSSGYIVESEYFTENYNEKNALYALSHGSYKQRFPAFLSLMSQNIWWCLAAVVAVVIIHYVILLPAVSENFILYEINYHSYFENFYINHFFNLFAYLFGISETAFCKPISAMGIFLSILFRLFYLVIVSGLLVNLLLKKLRL